MALKLLPIFAGSALLLAVAMPAITHAQSRQSLTKDPFAFPAAGQVRVVLFRPDVSVGEQSTGGLDQPNAGWTEQAREQLTAALGKAYPRRREALQSNCERPRFYGGQNSRR